jgi:predicted Fe-Mo cluster-binding NifX family protein
MVTIAVPIFQSRVSPVLDVCSRILLISLEQNREIDRKEIYLDDLSLSERTSVLKRSNITTIICGGISDVFYNILKGLGIHVIVGKAGEVEEVLAAFQSGRLEEESFDMPGFTSKK